MAWGNGPNDTKGYSRSKIPGYVTAQQFAAIIGTAQGTARDKMSGRGGKTPLGKEISGTWFISYEAVIEYLTARFL
jgi:hypothetical protein